MEINKLIDHTLLDSSATESDIKKLCDEAIEYNFKSVCVQPYWVKKASELLKGTDVLVCVVVGFPHGVNTPEIKLLEARQAVDDGATEVDMVMNVGAFKSGDLKAVKDEISAIAEEVRGKAKLKVILENCLLTKEEIKVACELSAEAKADFVKTSTGFSKSGANIEDVTLMKQVVGDQLGVKASGGVRDYETLLQYVEVGATRIGTSSGVKIVNQWKETF